MKTEKNEFNLEKVLSILDDATFLSVVSSTIQEGVEIDENTRKELTIIC